jgi:parvulin-like peptidyl-prolyl isomerase
MSEVLQIGDFEIPAADIIPFLASYQMLPNLLREMIIDRAINTIECTESEASTAVQQFCEKNQITSESQLQSWLDFHGMTKTQFQTAALRTLKIEKFKDETWGKKLESYFLSRKSQYDKAIYSLIRTKDIGVAQELYFRLQAGEQSFAELAQEYSQGSEAQTGGLIGPVVLSTPHPAIAQTLLASQPGQICPPLHIASEWFVIVRLEKLIPAQLDEPMRQQLLHELLTTWVQEQLQQSLMVKSQSSQTTV